MKRRTLTLYIFLGVLTLAGLLYSEMNKPREINWTPSFSRHHHIPFGCQVFFEQMEARFGDRWKTNQDAPFDWLRSQYAEVGNALLLINDDIRLDDPTRRDLLDWVGRGNRVLFSSSSPDRKLLDTLGIGITRRFTEMEGYGYDADTVYRRLVNPHRTIVSSLDQSPLFYQYYHYVVDSLETPGSTILGTASTQNWAYPEVDFVRVPFGQGEFYIHFYPYAFTNYIMLKGDEAKYATGVISYFSDAETLYWDEYEKSGKARYNSKLFILLSTREFRYAYYLALAGSLLYLLFQGKRKQRAIPVVAPPENQSANFTRTLGDMYLDGRSNPEVVEQKWEHFLEFIRAHLYLPTEHLDDHFFNVLSARSNHSVDELKQLFSWILGLKAKSQVTSSELIELDQKIHSFKEKTYGKL